MDINDFLFPPEFSGSILKRTIYLDDAPVESLIYRSTAQTEPTSPDIVTFWAEGGVLDEQSEKTLIEILLENFRYAFDVAKEREAALLFEKALNETKDPGQKANILMELWQLYQIINPTKAEERFLSLKRLMNSRVVTINEQVRSKWNSLCRNNKITVDPFQLRASALNKMDEGEYEEAERLYRQMIELNFELPGTLCHLARIQLLKDDENGAKKSINRAWKLRDLALNYVLPRIIFFKIMLAMLEDKNPAKWVYELKSALKDEYCFMAWTIKPTVNHYQSRLSDEDFSILMILADVLQDFQKMHLFDESIEFR